MGELENAIQSAFGNAIVARGKHVHQSRWSDDRIRDVDTLAFLGPKMKVRPLLALRRIKYLDVLNTWRKSLSDSIKAATRLVDVVCEEVEKGAVKYEP